MNDKLTSEQREQLHKDLFSQQFQHAQLARKYNISRERVRQIANKINAPPARLIQQQKTLQNINNKKIIKQNKLELYKKLLQVNHLNNVNTLSEMVLKGLDINEIAKQLNHSPNYISSRICQLRKKYPEKFPLKYTRH